MRHGAAYVLKIAAPLAFVLAAAACAPVTVDQAEQSCLRDAQLAQRPRSEVSVGIGASRGDIRPYASVRMDVSADYIRGRDPADAYNRCVLNRSGQFPTRSLYDQPGWRG
ncbi:MAG: hypothetical protein Q4G22_07030 [Paracoccus sp. (in: a-proteobacteria)]|uniref:hypothetical protein n=1 Tax=Paracoccus sp. TaxID=267 RepID=UPI0026DF7575|nr:hypothetical protein [Paracoccus sp. (in: a-proteobacteria)]MDO5631574.1 hypothetical protein [Paracoccus sp. (in: a-proteobacteria)]